ncbi:MAG: type II toxin-antitoxin system HicB family antitoxin [Bacteroidota bacterium]
MDALTYKGYIGVVKFSSEDEVFFGKIEHINDTITFESDNAHNLKKAFEDAVDDYLIFCTEKGVKPDKPFKGSFNVRIKPVVHKMAQMEALGRGISLNKFIETAIEKELENNNEKISASRRKKLDSLLSIPNRRASKGLKAE